MNENEGNNVELKELKNLPFLRIQIERLEKQLAVVKCESRGELSAELEQLKAERRSIEDFIYSVEDTQTKAILLLRFEDGMRWADIAAAIGGSNTEYSVKNRAYRFLRASDKSKPPTRQ